MLQLTLKRTGKEILVNSTCVVSAASGQYPGRDGTHVVMSTGQEYEVVESVKEIYEKMEEEN